MQKEREIPYFSGRAEAIKNTSGPCAPEPGTTSWGSQPIKQEVWGRAAVVARCRRSFEAVPETACRPDYLSRQRFDWPSAMKSVKPQAAKLNAQGADVFAKTDQALGEVGRLSTSRACVLPKTDRPGRKSGSREGETEEVVGMFDDLFALYRRCASLCARERRVRIRNRTVAAALSEPYSPARSHSPRA